MIMFFSSMVFPASVFLTQDVIIKVAWSKIVISNEKRRYSHKHVVGKDPKTPEISWLTVRFVFKYFWCHVDQCSTAGSRLGSCCRWCQNCCGFLLLWKVPGGFLQIWRNCLKFISKWAQTHVTRIIRIIISLCLKEFTEAKVSQLDMPCPVY